MSLRRIKFRDRVFANHPRFARFHPTVNLIQIPKRVEEMRPLSLRFKGAGVNPPPPKYPAPEARARFAWFRSSRLSRRAPQREGFAVA